MRFSSLFQQPAPPASAGEAPVRMPGPQEPPVAAMPDLPDDLDARVRMVGEWQLLEG